MKVFKFGGASVNSLDRIKNVKQIIASYSSETLVIVISAMGKTTNALEKVVESFFNKDKDQALALFESIKQSHLDTAKYLLVKEFNSTYENLVNYFTEVEWLLHDNPVREFDYYYDQVVCAGELLSTAIVEAYLREEGLNSTFIDIRDILRTDDNFRDAGINWEFSFQRVQEELLPLIKEGKIIITQGFIGATDENESTTLGREGSDYTAAILANILDAEDLTIWKDVEGVMNADPKFFPEAKLMSELNYEEVIEMAYYGAQVIHPKTIKPLQNKGIPLNVKSFINPDLKGTVIHNQPLKTLPPIIVIKNDQVLINLRTLDFSFVSEKPMSDLYELLAELKIKPNLVQTGAVHIQLCLDNVSDKIEKLALAASSIFEVMVEKELTLLTVRHFRTEILLDLTKGKQVEIEQRAGDTIQVLMK
jgi:aspartate kinase